MQNRLTNTKLALPFAIVKSQPNTQLPLFPDSMAHHKVSSLRIIGESLLDIKKKGKRYGVPKAQRVLSPQLLFKRFDHVREFLQSTLGLTTAEREGILRMLRFAAYYGQCYAKAAQICAEPGCSKRTFWRTIEKLTDLGIIERINRFLIREHAQISNLYLLHKLLLLIAKYLAEHIEHIWPNWLNPFNSMTWPELWDRLLALPNREGSP